jgi:hypothetical protein
MCPVEKMQVFAMKHRVTNYEALPQVFNHLANMQGLSLDNYLEIVERRPNLSAFIAEVAQHYDKR